MWKGRWRGYGGTVEGSGVGGGEWREVKGEWMGGEWWGWRGVEEGGGAKPLQNNVEIERI